MSSRDDPLQNDVEKLKRISTGSDDYSIPKTIEFVLWGLSIMFVVVMVVSMPWVGRGKPISGEVWLGFSLMGICIFGGLAFLVRIAFSRTAKEYDRELSRRLEGR